MDFQTKLEQLFQQNNERIKEVDSLDDLNQIRVQLLGKKGPITSVLRGMKDLAADER
ncbi:MAG TPA: phenylalanine--tRNA ligase subunit alpha, partial [Lactobacillus sp.]|nr:phenylalanine--tRNA ligase subunit alpha [Lactobacillus sp.]